MADQTPEREQNAGEPDVPASGPSSGSTAQASVAPAVHDSDLWDGPRWIHNLGAQPIYVETKQQYWELLNTLGFTMKDQQESVTGPEQPSIPWVTPETPAVERPLLQFTQDDAHAIQAVSAVWHRYDLREVLQCARCFEMGQPSGCRPIITNRRVRIECRCGVREYLAPLGVDISVHRLPNSAKVFDDRTQTELTEAMGPVILPTEILSSQEARILRHHLAVLRDHELETMLFCHQCCQGHIESGQEMLLHVTPDQIVIKCKCRVLFHVG